MTRGAWMCRQQDDGLRIWFAPRENEKPFTDSERAQKWRLSLASLLFFTVLLSDHLWFCAEAKLTRTRDKEQGPLSGAGMGGRPAAPAAGPLLPPSPRSSQRNLTRVKKDIFLRNFTKPLCPLENYDPFSPPSSQCFSVDDAEYVCRTLNEGPGRNLSDLHLSFCNSYTLSDLVAGLSNPETSNCSGDVVRHGDVPRCRQCVQAYQRYDQHAQEKYEEFEILLQKYLQSDEYSVKSCSEDCKVGCPGFALAG
ncbi:NALCN channel auxiliary factor 1 [Ambystoma mexicanum]|uniref:NALCN channel auxiliary factor 1 n=1 Tax=Ambystoma mexicanum TaxID=8296 RepID=UPI0037E9AE8B